MNFPSFGDAESYRLLGESCAKFLAGDAGATCYSDLRPVGIVLYYAVPFLTMRDQVTVEYLTLLMNLLVLLLFLYSGSWLVRQLLRAEFVSESGRTAYINLSQAVFFLLVLALSIGYLPVRLSDHQSLACFMCSFMLLSRGHSTGNTRTVFFAGLLAGASVLLKQNYIVAVFAVIVGLFFTLEQANFKKNARFAIYYCFGASSALIQLLWVYANSGVFWFYDPAALEHYAPSNAQPFVELIAYSHPIQSAYLTRLSDYVSSFEYFSIKFYYGFLKFYWSVYLGDIPLRKAPELIQYSPRLMFAYAGFFLAMTAISFGALLLKNRWLTILIFSAYCFAVYSAYSAHIESRYFYFPRTAYLILLIVSFDRATQWIRRRHAPKWSWAISGRRRLCCQGTPTEG